jgi:prevent-host-death family protein
MGNPSILAVNWELKLLRNSIFRVRQSLVERPACQCREWKRAGLRLIRSASGLTVQCPMPVRSARVCSRLRSARSFPVAALMSRVRCHEVSSTWDCTCRCGRGCEVLTWPCGHGYTTVMDSISAGKFKDQCLKIMDAVAATKTPMVVTKRGRPVVRVVPYSESTATTESLAGSIISEEGDPFGTGEKWNADLP